MNCYRKVLHKLGVNADSQGRSSYIVLLLQLCSQYEAPRPRPNQYQNPFAEVIRRPSDFDCWAVQDMARLFGARMHPED